MPQTTGTTWVFDAPATPESQNTQLMILTQAQSQELDGTGNNTQYGTLPSTRSDVNADGSRAPAALFVFTGGTAGLEEENTQQGGQGGTNDATQSTTGLNEDTRQLERCNTIPTQVHAPAAPEPGEDTEADRELREVYGDTNHRNDG